ncbi:MAG: hypothetical protein U0531_03285 [Dehalococcoidia bacterium]
MAVSTGTNNVFPAKIEGTVAGPPPTPGLRGRDAGGGDGATRQDAPDRRAGHRRPGVDRRGGDACRGSSPASSGKADRVARRPADLRASPAAMGMAALGGLLRPVTPDEDAAST